MLQIQGLGRPDRVDQHLPVPLQPQRRSDWTLPGPGGTVGREGGSSLPGALGLGLGGLASWATFRSFHLALGSVQRWDRDCGMEVTGGRTWVQALGFFLTEVFCASHSGGGDPPARVMRVDWERPASAGMCAVPHGVQSPEASPATHAFFFQSPDWSRNVDGLDPASGGWGGRARPFSMLSWVSVVRHDFFSPLPNSLNSGRELGTSLGRPGCPL